ncbi:MAG: hypothetical protein RIQ79_529 [Verrucomicrobiota bacterium]|jgi:hypothetical protein
MSSSGKNIPRVLIVLIGLLLCSNLGTALLAFLVIERLDERYSREFNKAVPGLHELMLLAQESTNTHRAAGNLLLARDESESKLMWTRLDEARQKELDRLTEVFSKGPVSAGDPMEPLWLASHNYNQLLAEYLEFVKQGKRDEALAYRLDKLRPSFDLYQQRQREESVRLNLEAMQSNREISAQAKERQSLLLGFGGWPFAVLIAMLAIFAVLGFVLWKQLRGIESSEGMLRTDRSF